MASNKEGKCFIFKAAGYSSKDALKDNIAEFKGSKMVKNLVNCSPASDPSSKNELRKSLESISASSLTLYFTGYGGCEVLGSDNEGKVYLYLSEDEVVYIEEIVNWLAPSCKTGQLFFELYLPKGSQTLSTQVLPARKDFTIAISGLAEKETGCAFWTKGLVAAYEEGSSLSSILTNVNYLYTEKSGLPGIPMFTSSIKKSKPVDSAPRSTHVQATSSANTSSTQSSSPSSSSVSSTPVSTGNTSSVKTTTSQHDSSKTSASSSPDILSKVPEEKELASVLEDILNDRNRDTWLKFAKQLLGEIGFKYERLSMQPSVAIFINTVYKNKYRPTWGQVINALDKPRIVKVEGVRASDKLKEHLNI